MCPGHFWLLKFGKVPGNNSCVEKKFKLGTRKYEEYNKFTNIPRKKKWSGGPTCETHRVYSGKSLNTVSARSAERV